VKSFSTWEGATDADGKASGEGIFKTKGEVYVGTMKHGTRNGTGRNTWPDGTVYEGALRIDGGISVMHYCISLCP